MQRISSIISKLKQLLKSAAAFLRQEYAKCNPAQKGILVSALIGAVWLSGFLGLAFSGRVPGIVSSFFAAIFTRAGRSLLFLFLLAILFAFMFFRWRGTGADPVLEKDHYEKADSNVYGDEHFMSVMEIKENGAGQVTKEISEIQNNLLGELNGYYIGTPEKVVDQMNPTRWVTMNRNRHICGTSGTMKTRTVIRPEIFQCVKNGWSMVITDPKGELCDEFFLWLMDKGYRVRVWNTKYLKHSDGWNIFDSLRDSEDIDTDMDLIKNVLIANTARDGDNPFFTGNLATLLQTFLWYVYDYYPEEKRNLAEVYLMTTIPKETVDAKIRAVERSNARHPCVTLYKQFLQNDKTTGSGFNGLAERLSVLRNRTLQKVISESEIDITLPAKEKCAYFCVTPDQHSTFDVMTSLFVNMCIVKMAEYADHQPEKACKVPVQFLLDEFPNIAAIVDFQKKISTLRSRNIAFTMAYQNIPQMQNRYPHDVCEEIFSNCDTAIFLGSNDEITNKYWSEKLGELTTVVESKRENHSKFELLPPLSYGENTGYGKRKLKQASEVRRLNPHKLWVLIRGFYPMELFKVDYTRYPQAIALTRMQSDHYIPIWHEKLAKQGVKGYGWDEDAPVFLASALRQKEDLQDITRFGFEEAEDSGKSDGEMDFRKEPDSKREKRIPKETILLLGGSEKSREEMSHRIFTKEKLEISCINPTNDWRNRAERSGGDCYFVSDEASLRDACESLIEHLDQTKSMESKLYVLNCLPVFPSENGTAAESVRELILSSRNRANVLLMEPDIREDGYAEENCDQFTKKIIMKVKADQIRWLKRILPAASDALLNEISGLSGSESLTFSSAGIYGENPVKEGVPEEKTEEEKRFISKSETVYGAYESFENTESSPLPDADLPLDAEHELGETDTIDVSVAKKNTAQDLLRDLMGYNEQHAAGKEKQRKRQQDRAREMAIKEEGSRNDLTKKSEDMGKREDCDHTETVRKNPFASRTGLDDLG